MLLNSLWVSRLVLVAALSLAIATASRGEDLRTWTDSTGQFDLQAKFVSIEDGMVNLVRENGAKMKIALDKLSRADQEYVAGLISAVGGSTAAASVACVVGNNRTPVNSAINNFRRTSSANINAGSTAKCSNTSIATT